MYFNELKILALLHKASISYVQHLDTKWKFITSWFINDKKIIDFMIFR